jgi:hypothetical protein
VCLRAILHEGCHSAEESASVSMCRCHNTYEQKKENKQTTAFIGIVLVLNLDTKQKINQKKIA